MKFHTAFDRPRAAGLSFENVNSRTKQQFKDEADINRLVSRYIKTGSFGQTGTRPPQFGDFVGIDYTSMQNQIVHAQEQFAALPSEVRRRFANDPGNLLAFLADPRNQDEAVRLGLAAAPAAPAPVPAPDPEPVKQTSNEVPHS